jgi:tetratricopeptide (TPR) repeat protein
MATPSREREMTVTEKLGAESSIAPLTLDLDEKFFEDGIQFERETTAARGESPMKPTSGHVEEEPLDPEILERLRPEVLARRAKYTRCAKALGMGCALLGLAALMKQVSTKGDPDAAAREMAAYSAAHAWDTTTQDKQDCQALLGQGAFAKAVEAGERAVGIDPTDGKAWLLLGRAYRSLGREADARRSFDACLKQAQREPLLDECKEMLQ